MAKSVQERLQSAYVKAGGIGAGALPWASIIQAILALFQGCATPAATKRWAKRHPDAFKEIVQQKLSEESLDIPKKSMPPLLDASHTTFLGMTNAEIESFVDDNQ